MGILGWLGIGKELAEPIKAVGNLYTTDKERLAATKDIAEVVQKSDMETVRLNRINALDKRFFDAGWRPLLGWTCGACVALFYVPQLIVGNYIWFQVCMAQGKILPFPIESADLMNLIYLLLGFGSYKTIENFIKR